MRDLCIAQVLDELAINLDATQIRVGRQELIVVVQQYRRLVNGRETNCRNARLRYRVNATSVFYTIIALANPHVSRAHSPYE